MDEKDFSGIGDQIRSTVQNAIDSMDFKQLNQNINITINQALNETRKQIYYQKERAAAGSKSQTYSPKETTGSRENAVRTEQGKHEPSLKMRQVGRTAGILLTVFGSIGMAISLVLALLMLSAILFFDASLGITLTVIIFLLMLSGGCLAMLLTGVFLRRRLRRMKNYMLSLEGRRYCSIQELADRAGRNKRFVVNDLRKMIQLGMVPETYLDARETYLILGSETYRQYKQAEVAYKNRIQETEKVSERLERESKDETAEAGERYLRELREANRAITGEAIAPKLQRLELVVNRIFEAVKNRPDRLGGLEKFMDYYLPTTLKLVRAYRDFHSEEIQGENIRNAKREIEQTLDTINGAFERLLDDLYQDAAFDVTSDAAVLQTMLEKDGWTESDFKQEDRT